MPLRPRNADASPVYCSRTARVADQPASLPSTAQHAGRGVSLVVDPKADPGPEPDEESEASPSPGCAQSPHLYSFVQLKCYTLGMGPCWAGDFSHVMAVL